MIKNMRSISSFVLLFLALQAGAQVFVESGPVGTSRDGQISVYGLNGANSRIPYYKFKGSPFLNPDWLKAELYRPDGKPMGIFPVRLNLVTHEVHFLDSKGYELAANDGIVSRVTFIDSLSDGKPRRTFRNDYEGVSATYNRNKRYAEELNPSDPCLLRVDIRDGREADSMFGTLKRYYFADRFDYFVRVGKRVEKVRRLSQEEIFALLPAKQDAVDFVKKNKLNMKREEDVVRLFDYLASVKLSSPNQ